MGALNAARLLPWVAVGSLVVLFVWVYGRFVGRLYFVLDDYIETGFALQRTWPQALIDSVNGTINWSGYRPLTYALRASMAHAFGLHTMWGYYAVSLGLLLACVLLAWHVVRQVSRSDLWAWVAAAVVLLLPSHNEAVLYMSANANLIALFFSLVALEGARRVWSHDRLRPLWMVAAWLAYGCAVLAYEVTLPLPGLILAAHWIVRRRRDESLPARSLRATWPLYAGMVVVAAAVLGLRVWAMGGTLNPTRADYAISLAVADLARGYRLFLGQLVLLHSSAWLHVPLYADLREWMAPTNPRALASMLLAAASSLAVFALAFRSRRETRGCRRGEPPLWVVWGLVWVLLIALPFALLTGRNPENRYVTIPSFGYAVAIAALAAWLAGPLIRRDGRARLRQALAIGSVTALLTFYAYVSTSDVAEWERASAHTRAFMTQAPALVETTGWAGLVQLGVPPSVGGAYTFTTGESFRWAVEMLYGNTEPIISNDLWLRQAMVDHAPYPDEPIPLIGFGYNRGTHTVGVLDSVWACGVSCEGMALIQPGPEAPAERWIYAQFYSESQPELGGLGLLLTAGPDGVANAVTSCWGYYDASRVMVDPKSFSDAELQARCAARADALLDAGVVRLLATAPASAGAPAP